MEGGAKVYRLRSLGASEGVVEGVEGIVRGRGEGVGLMTGMITLLDAAYSPIDMTAVAIAEEGSNEVYLAVRICGTERGLGTFTEKGVYGGKRVVIVARPGDAPILECIFNIV